MCMQVYMSVQVHCVHFSVCIYAGAYVCVTNKKYILVPNQ